MAEPRDLDRRLRHFHEGARAWEVRERYALDVPGVPRERCLVFMSESAVRRVYEYPTAWYDLTDAELRALMEAPVRRRFAKEKGVDSR